MSLDGPVAEGSLLTGPSPERIEAAVLTAFARFVEEETGRSFEDYRELWRWSTSDPAGFWRSLADFAHVPFARPPDEVLSALRGPGGELRAEGAQWFEGAELNYVDSFLRADASALALIARDESGGRSELTYGELASLAGMAAAGLRSLGVGRGDRVAAVLTNGVAAVATFLAAASLGAVFSSCAPEFGASSMVDRFAQISPKVLVATGSYRYGGRHFDLGDKISELSARMPAAAVTTFEALCGDAPASPLAPVAVPFSHPLWVLYSSGTTGLPKAIVHGHGGIVLEHLKTLRLQSDLGPGDRFFWFSTTGWMMWNLLVGGLLTGAAIVCYDGSPLHPDPLSLFAMSAEEKVTYFGTSAPFIEACRRQGLRPRDTLDLTAVRTIGSTGAPLSPEGFAWAASSLAEDVDVASVSGGTDVCTAFLTSSPWLPVRAGELQCAALGCAAAAFNDAGQPVTDEVGELVVTAPMPSMPIGLWGDEDGSRLHEAYFATYPGVWRHGDFVKETTRGSWVVYGRSDATLNRGGVRMGTAEFYRVVEAHGSVNDSLVVDTSELGREGRLLLLVVLAEDAEEDVVVADLVADLRRQLSPRHVPDTIVPVRALPRTLNGKKVEVPLRKILLGAHVEDVVSKDALADPGALVAVVDALGEAGLLEPREYSG